MNIANKKIKSIKRNAVKKKLKKAKAFAIAFPGEEDSDGEGENEDWDAFFAKLSNDDLVKLNDVKFEPMGDHKNVAE